MNCAELGAMEARKEMLEALNKMAPSQLSGIQLDQVVPIVKKLAAEAQEAVRH